MANWTVVKENKAVFFLMSLVVGLIIGVLVATGLNLPQSTIADGTSAVAEVKTVAKITTNEIETQNAFVKVAEEVGKAVVSIKTSQTVKMGGGRRQFSPFGEEFFDEFFKEFFGDSPQREFERYGLGSGFIINEDGYILTNEHVILDADKIDVTLRDGREFRGEVKGTDPRSDLAIVKIKAKGLPVTVLGDSDTVKTGQWAIAIGNPFGIAVRGNPEPTVSVGVISALNRTLPRTDRRQRKYDNLLQTDAAINPGNSGGPLVNIRGEVIGLNVAIATATGYYEGVGFAIPINAAKDIIGDLIQGKKVQYGWLGIGNKTVLDDNLAEYLGLPDRKGVFVDEVFPDTPAEKAGIKVGDVIKTFDGNNVEDMQDLVKRVGRADVGKKIKAGIIRDKKEKVLEIEVGERPKEDEIAARPKEGVWRGIEVKDISPEIVSRYNIEEGSGVIVTNVEMDSPGDEAGLRIGDLISEINWKPVKSTKDYNEVTKELKGNVLVRTNRGYIVVKEAAPKKEE